MTEGTKYFPFSRHCHSTWLKPLWPQAPFISLFKTGYKSTKLICGLFIVETMHLVVSLVIFRRAEWKLWENLKNPWCTDTFQMQRINFPGFPGSNTSALEAARLQTLPAQQGLEFRAHIALFLWCHCCQLTLLPLRGNWSKFQKKSGTSDPESVWWTSEQHFSGHLERVGSQNQGFWWDLSSSSWFFFSPRHKILGAVPLPPVKILNVLQEYHNKWLRQILCSCLMHQPSAQWNCSRMNLDSSTLGTVRALLQMQNDRLLMALYIDFADWVTHK